MNQTKTHFWTRGSPLEDFSSFNKTQTNLSGCTVFFQGFSERLLQLNLCSKQHQYHKIKINLAGWMCLKVVLKSAYLKVDFGGFIFYLLLWKEGSREEACLKRLKTKKDCNNHLQASAQTFLDLLGERVSWWRETEHTLLKQEE